MKVALGTDDGPMAVVHRSPSPKSRYRPRGPLSRREAKDARDLVLKFLQAYDYTPAQCAQIIALMPSRATTFRIYHRVVDMVIDVDPEKLFDFAHGPEDDEE